MDAVECPVGAEQRILTHADREGPLHVLEAFRGVPQEILRFVPLGRERGSYHMLVAFRGWRASSR